MNWQIGDKAICITPGSPIEGCEVVIIGGLHRTSTRDQSGHIEYDRMMHEVDPGYKCPYSFSGKWGASPHNLKPIPDEYDGKQVITWDECPYFKPRELVTVTV